MPPENTIPFCLPGFEIDRVDEYHHVLIIEAHSIAVSAVCPCCGQSSTRVHSYYTRSPRGLPCNGRKVRLVLQVRRYRCQISTCIRKTFAERIPQVVPVHGQRTTQFTPVLRDIAFELNAEAGARVTQHMQMDVSGDTLLRVIRQTEVPFMPTPRVLGVDDWAFRRGHNYGTLLVDLEQHRPVELLPDRDAETLAAWLRTHPGVEIISRDRAGAYAEGSRLGAPEAMQVADRWHLLKNLGDTLAATYDRHQRLLHQIRIEKPPSGSTKTAEQVPDTPLPAQPVRKTTRARVRNTLTHAREQAREQRRAYWLGKFQEVHTLRDQGLSMGAIMRQTGLSRRTVRKYCRLPELPKKTSPKRGPRLVDPYRDYLRQRLLAENPSSKQLWREICEQGFKGGHTTAYKCVTQLRYELGLPPPKYARATTITPKTKPLTARTLVALVLCRPDTLPDEKLQLIAHACQLHPEIQQATQLARNFAAMLRQRDAEQFDNWLQEATASEIPGLVGFVSGLRRDYAAVKAAFISPWSNGQVEGQINRLKCIKRQMYGRARFDLLRLRVLHPT